MICKVGQSYTNLLCLLFEGSSLPNTYVEPLFEVR